MLTTCSGKESAKKGRNVELEIHNTDDTLEGGAMKAVVEKFNEGAQGPGRDRICQ